MSKPERNTGGCRNVELVQGWCIQRIIIKARNDWHDVGDLVAIATARHMYMYICWGLLANLRDGLAVPHQKHINGYVLGLGQKIIQIFRLRFP